jgi:hypothetical protein
VLLEHLRDGEGELLAHLFMGAVTRRLLLRYIDSSGDPDLHRIFGFLEERYLSDGQRVRELLIDSLLATPAAAATATPSVMRGKR